MLFFVIAKVADRDYLTKVEAESALSAEHSILDKGVCTRFGYGVDAAMAYDYKTMKTDCFVGNALAAEPINFLDLIDIISLHNELLREQVANYIRVREIKNQIDTLTSELEKLTSNNRQKGLKQ